MCNPKKFKPFSHWPSKFRYLKFLLNHCSDSRSAMSTTHIQPDGLQLGPLTAKHTSLETVILWHIRRHDLLHPSSKNQIFGHNMVIRNARSGRFTCIYIGLSHFPVIDVDVFNSHRQEFDIFTFLGSEIPRNLPICLYYWKGGQPNICCIPKLSPKNMI